MPTPLRVDLPAPCSSWEQAETLARDPAERAAVVTFRRLLRDDWPGWGRDHPLARQFFLSFQGQPPEGVRLAALLQRLEGVPNINEVLRDVRALDWRQYTHGVMCLEIVAGLRSRCAAVRFLARVGADSTPDAAAYLVNRDVTLEFKAFHGPDSDAPWEALDDYLLRNLSFFGLSTSRFEIVYEDAAFHYAKAVLDGLLRVHFSEAREYVALPQGTGKARVSGLANEGRTLRPGREHVDAWRLRQKVPGWSRAKFRDVPGPTVLVVRTEDLYRPFARLPREEASATIAEFLLEAIGGVSSLSALLLYEEAFIPAPPVACVSEETFVATWGTSAAGMARKAFFLASPGAAIPLTEAERDVLMADPAPW